MQTQYWLLSDEGKETKSLLDSQALQILLKGFVVFFKVWNGCFKTKSN